MNNKVKDSGCPQTGVIDAPHNFSNILANETAQEFLLGAKKLMNNGEIFEFIYSTQVTWAEEMKEKRKKRREYLHKSKIKCEPSFIGTPSKEQEYYDTNAKDVAMKAMLWLDKAQNKTL